MKKGHLSLILFILFFAFHFQSLAQFTSEEVAERPKWEEFLKTANIVGYAQPWEEKEAVTRPWELILEKDGITKKAVWKDCQGRMKGYMENWKWEIAAYCMDKYLGLNMVPPTVEKRFRGDRGSCQIYAGVISLKDKIEQGIEISSDKTSHLNRSFYLQRAFDNLIANEDRTQNNCRFTEDWRLILIDHSRTFRTPKKFTKKLIYDENYKSGPAFIMKQLPRTFVEKVKSLNFDVIKGIVGEYLTDKEIKSVLTRRDLIIDWINERIKKFGEAAVLY